MKAAYFTLDRQRSNVPEIDQYTSPLDDVEEESDYRFQLPDPETGEVLIVDDDEDSVALTKLILEAGGYGVHAFRQPSALLSRIREGVPTVLLTDFDMPEMTGLELAQKAQEIDPGVRVIMLTGSGDEATAQAAL